MTLSEPHAPYAHPMRILHLSWEYPPLVYGGLGRHVHALAEAQAARGDDVVVITQAINGLAEELTVDGVRIIRVPHDPPSLPFDEEHLLAWVMTLESAMVRGGLQLEAFDIVHAHDWIVAHAATTLRAFHSDSALVATIHATEAGRHQGWLPSPLSDAVHSTEHWLVHQAERVIVCSQHMAREVDRLFGDGSLDSEHVAVIANGIDAHRWHSTPSAAAAARDRHAATGPLIVFVGRLEWEKGAHTLIDALPRLRRRLPGLRVVIAGRGGAADNLARQARDRRVASMVEFTGWLPERELHSLIAGTDALVVPSIYEPFGLVALEGAALGAPLVVAETGGLAEFVVDGQTGRCFTPGDAADLARAVTAALSDPETSRAMAARARTRLDEAYRWELVASHTADVYAAARTSRRDRTAPPARVPGRDINLLRG